MSIPNAHNDTLWLPCSGHSACADPVGGGGSLTCPRGLSACTCPQCAYGTSGPCHGPLGRCAPYATGGVTNTGDASSQGQASPVTQPPRCPAGHFECGSGVPPLVERSCPRCSSAFQGPCQHPVSRVCYNFLPGAGAMCSNGCSGRGRDQCWRGTVWCVVNETFAVLMIRRWSGVANMAHGDGGGACDECW
jgi:hypothetical protein